uniref:Uncharacterized protein n=1 Tax=Paramormyrops kingsleyae TaxID=1676925 RepID=A0A3B3RB96_9TELE
MQIVLCVLSEGVHGSALKQPQAESVLGVLTFHQHRVVLARLGDRVFVHQLHSQLVTRVEDQFELFVVEQVDVLGLGKLTVSPHQAQRREQESSQPNPSQKPKPLVLDRHSNSSVVQKANVSKQHSSYC